jgi:excisionase family DNA binding protein
MDRVCSALPGSAVHRSTVYDLIRSRRLVSITIGRARRVPADAIRDFIERETEEAAA